MSNLSPLTWTEALSLLQEGFLVSHLPNAFLRFIDPPTTVVGPLIYLRDNDYFEAWCERPHDRWRWRANFYAKTNASGLGLFELPFKVSSDHVIGLEGLVEIPFEARREQQLKGCKRGPLTFFEKRQLEKAESRARDAEDLRTGRKTVAQLNKENGIFSFPSGTITLSYPGRGF